MRLHTKSVLAAGVLLTATLATAQSTSGDAEGNWNAIARCAAIDAAEQRHACVDGVLRQAGLLSEERVAQRAREEFGSPVRPERQNQAQAVVRPEPTAEPPAEPMAAPPLRAADIDELETTIAAVRMSGNRRLTITTAEGSVWEQTQSETFRALPEVGDAFSIDRTSLGGFRCKFQSSSVYRCRRAD